MTKKFKGEPTPQKSKKTSKSNTPLVNQAKLEEKLTKYLLNFEHPKGQHKAKYFANLGYTIANWQNLASQLKFDITKATKEDKTQFGHQPYSQLIKINSADGASSSIIQTGWELKEGMKEIDLITAYPAHRDDV